MSINWQYGASVHLRSILTFAIWPICCLLFWGSIIAIADVDPCLTENDRAAFKSFDKLGFPDCAKLRLARVFRFPRKSGLPKEGRAKGELRFLISDVNGKVAVWNPANLCIENYQKVPVGSENFSTISYDEVSLRDEVPGYILGLRRAEDNPNDGIEPYPRLGKNAIFFIWARICEAKKLDELACRLLIASKQEKGWMYGGNEALSYENRIRAEMAYALIFDAVLDCKKSEVSRKTLSDEFHRIARTFPESVYAGSAKEMGAVLDRMIKEDREHQQAAQKNFGSMTKEEHIAELIFRLRDQTGAQFTTRSPCDIFARDRDENFKLPVKGKSRKEMSPAMQLVEMGKAAIPQLKAALRDKQLTRAVQFQNPLFFSHDVLTVGDCAAIIIKEIESREGVND
ncbi:MAG TPA: hypothetical protein VGP68_14340 [Gemmataceae bacterium]|jgi:hypothetical protein|nr:hypothetical protein [Gemmataceae bacterium]